MSAGSDLGPATILDFDTAVERIHSGKNFQLGKPEEFFPKPVSSLKREQHLQTTTPPEDISKRKLSRH